MYAELAKYSDATANNRFFDELGVHPYSACGGSPQTPSSPDYTGCPNHTRSSTGYKMDPNFLGLKKLMTSMNANGDYAKKMYVGEYGFSHNQTWMIALPDDRRGLRLKRAYTLAKGLGGV
jgi:hypothetical protein